MKRRILALTFLAMAGGACNRLVPVAPPQKTLLAASTDEEVRRAIVRALARENMRPFSAVEEAPGRFVVRYQKGDESFRVAVDYNQSGIAITYLDSEGLSSETRPDGTVFVHKVYEKRVALLATAIVDEVDRPPRDAASGPSQTQPAQPVPDPVDPNVAIIDYVGQRLADQGYACAHGDTGFQCTAPNDNWPVVVAYYPDTREVAFDSFEKRAFGAPCERFTTHLTDLRSAPAAFAVSCSDETQQFQMATRVQYDSDLDIPAWMQTHRDSRYQAWKLLDSVQAIRK